MSRVTPQHELDMLTELIGTEPAGVGIDDIAQKLGGAATTAAPCNAAWPCWWSKDESRCSVNGLPLATAVCQRLLVVSMPQRRRRCKPQYRIMFPSLRKGRISAPMSPSHATCAALSAIGWDFWSNTTQNYTTYLPQDLREQLHALGRSPADQTPAGTFAKDIFTRLLIDLSWASSHLEGNTYSCLDTERLIEYGQAAEGKDALETQMILNHK